MVELIDLLLDIAVKSLKTARTLGKTGKESADVGGDKRSCLLEERLRNMAIHHLNTSDLKFRLVSEGFDDYCRGDPEFNFYQDTVDGTVYFVRSRTTDPPTITTVLSVARVHPRRKPTYGDVEAAVIANLGTEELVRATKRAMTIFARREEDMNLFTDGGNGGHDPVYQSDFYWRQNAVARLLLRNPEKPECDAFENLNTGSVAWQGVLVASGDADCHYNLVGPKGYELAAMHSIVAGAGGYSIDFRTGRSLDETVIEPNKRVPVIMARHKALAEEIDGKLSILRPHLGNLKEMARVAADFLAKE